MHEKKADRIDVFRKAGAKVVLDYYQKHLSYERWDSSAKKLERKLKKRGITDFPKLYYEYKFPGGAKNFQVNKKEYFALCFCNLFELYSKREIWGNKKTMLKNFLEDISPFAVMNLLAFFNFCICLAISDVQEIKDSFEQTSRECKKQVEQLAFLIWQLNPELQCIEDYKNVWFVNGAIYGFAPKEIEFFIQLSRRRETRDMSYERSGKDEEVNHCINNLHKIAKFTGDWPGYFLAPETSDEILTAIENHEQMQIQQQNLRNGLSIS